jgi:hypothetical protein
MKKCREKKSKEEKKEENIFEEYRNWNVEEWKKFFWIKVEIDMMVWTEK